MRVNWQQELEGCTLLEIRDIVRALPYADTPLNAQFVADRLNGTKAERQRRATRLLDGLLVSGLIEPQDSKAGSFILTDSGVSLRAAPGTKRFKRDRADRAIAKMLDQVAHINLDPLFLYDVGWVAVYGSYIADAPDLGDIDLAIELKGRWSLKGTDSDRERRLGAFVAKFPPPDHIDKSYIERLCWPETYIRRQLRVDPAIKIIDRSGLEAMGCAYRTIYPDTRDVPAKPDWSCQREEIILRQSVKEARQC
jgi:hypothetical protein